ncbi:hypothetical protein BGZ73_004369 [Actinomortierella ambigua]|nr:hypothetical protein BGZ73_004369 [Actinomortierella ambigua]
MTMDPNALERELDHVAHELHSTVSSMLNTMQSSFLGGLDSLSREVRQFEDQHRQFPWTFRHFTDGVEGGPKKRYRITIEEIPSEESEEDAGAYGHAGHRAPIVSIQGHPRKETLQEKGSDDKSKDVMLVAKEVDAAGHELFSIQQGKKGTQEEGKTVITTTTNSSIAPGLLDWLLFTTHEDSFFRRLGRGAAEYYPPPQAAAAKIEEIQDRTAAVPPEAAVTPSTTTTTATNTSTCAEQHPRAALVDKVKQVGASWERGARDWWHWGNDKWEQHRNHRHQHQQQDTLSEEERRQPFWLRRENNHVLSGSGLENEQQQQQVKQTAQPRWQSWDRHETTVTHPDGTIESKMVSSLNGETETRTKLIRPDGTIEETVTHDRNHNGHHRGGWGDRHRQARSWLHPHEVVESVMKDEQPVVSHSQDDEEDRSWPPKAWRRRQAQEQERNV